MHTIKKCQLPSNKLNYTYLVIQIPILYTIYTYIYLYLPILFMYNNDYCLRYVDFQTE